VRDGVLFQPHAQAAVAAVDGVAGHPSERHPGGQGALEHRLAQLRLGLEAHVLADPGRSAPGSVVGPAGRQVQVPVDERDAVWGGVGQEHRDLAVLLLAGRAGVLALHPGRAVTLLDEAGLIHHQHRVRVAQVLDDIVAQVVADPVGVPPGAVEQPLHAVGDQLAGLLGQPPAVLALDLAEQALQVAQGPPAGFDAAEPWADPLVQLDQPVGPHPGLFLGLPDRRTRHRRALRRPRHVAPRSLDRKRATYPKGSATVGLVS
jgi:hypothetical protein